MSAVLRTRAPSVTAAPPLTAHRPRTGRRRGLLLSALIASVVGGALLAVLLWPESATARPPAAKLESVPVGSIAPRVGLSDAAAGGAGRTLPVPGAVTLVSFLATQPDGADTPSRSQAVELVSLASQYAAKGLSVAIVDDTSSPASANALQNTAYDWQLGPLPLFADPEHAAAYRYGVASAPATLLIGRDGRVLDRWSGYVLTAVAAQAISAALTQGPRA